MIANYPLILLIPGLLFIAGGFFYYSRAASLDDGSELGTRMRIANRSTGNLSIVLGAVLLMLGIPLGVAIKLLQ